MLDIKKVYKLQTDYSISEGRVKQADVDFGTYVDECRVFIANNLPEEFNTGGWDSQKKTDYTDGLVTRYVDKHPIFVEGYIKPEGTLDSELLLEDLRDAISGAGILKDALEDPDVDEIQINDKNTIFVQKHGTTIPYVDAKGRIMQFTSNSEIDVVINRLIDDGGDTQLPQFNAGNPILNAKTSRDQYRINAVHHSANTQDKPPYNFPITNVVIRKFKEVNLTVDDLVGSEAITDKMGRLIKYLGQAELKMFCVGPTGSGKTTLLRIIAESALKNTNLFRRMILVQNPAEITFKERDTYGRNIHNVVHWEVIDKASLAQLISNTLRQTPEIILIGEMRENEEFFQALRMMRTGHKTLGTYHAEGPEDAMARFATELSSVGGMSYVEALRLASEAVDVVITQFKFPDGKRRVMGISEIQGITEDGSVRFNDLFKFVLTGETVENEYGLTSVSGYFSQTGTLSDYTKNKMYMSGISQKNLDEFCKIDNSDIPEHPENRTA